MSEALKQFIARELKLVNGQTIAEGIGVREILHFLHHTEGALIILSSDSEREDLSRFKPFEVEKISVLPLENFNQRFLEKAQKNNPDIILLSQSFFNSGLVIANLEEFIITLSKFCRYLIIDGRNAFLHVPFSLKKTNDNIFYVASIDGAIEFTVTNSPEPLTSQPLPSPQYTLCPEILNVDNATELIHAVTKKRQDRFREIILSLDHPYLCEKNILSVDYNHHGPILVFALPSPQHTLKVYDEFKDQFDDLTAIGSRLIFGFDYFKS